VSDTPATPRPAATIVLLRRGGRHADRALEILLVRRGDGQSFMPGVWVFPGGMIEEGESAEQCAARELAEETAIELAPDADLHPWSRWVTPEIVPVRFDTYFFVALAPAHSPPQPDGAEVDDAGWFNPQRALETHAEGRLKLVFPTIRTLESLVPYATAEEVIAAAPDRDLEPILPRVAGTRAEHRVLLPGDPGYEEAAPDINRLSP
jgi:8-oxo-dGTP pyrophosphatase MutT (NUDIX family)